MANSARFLLYGVRRIFIFLLLALLGAPCFAGTFTAYGPQTYLRGTGDPVTVTNTFTVLNPNTQYTLRVHNGGLVDSNTDRVSSTTVTVNGVIVVAPNDLNQNVAEVDKPVTLLAANQIDVQVRGAPGGTLSIDILGIDNDFPSIKASASPLANDGGWNNSSVLVTFTCTDATSGVASCPAPVSATLEGAGQVITGQAVDKAGNITPSPRITVSIDKTPPTIIANASPAPNPAGWNNTDVTIKYSCADALSGIAACPDSVVITTEGRRQSVARSVADLAGNTASTGSVVNLDKTPPVVTISSPAPGSVVSTSTITVSGNASDLLSGVASVNCNGVAAALTGGSFSCSQTLVAGTNKIQVQAIDAAGNSSSAITSVGFTPPPEITITSPTNSALFNQSPINVTGNVTNPAAQVTVNGITAPVSGNSFLATVPVQEGISTITAVAANADGTTGTASVQVDLDTTPPHVAIYAPLDGSVTPDASVTVTGLVNDIVVGTVNPQQATVKVNGVDAQVANRSFSISNIPLVVGPNLIHATAVDAAGNEATATVTVVRQAPGRPAVKVFFGNNQSGTISSPLAQPLVAQVVNASGQPVANVSVVFRVTAQNGTLGTTNPGLSDIAVNTDAQGLASVQLTLGSHAGAGNNLVEASATGVPATAVFSASASSTGATLINVDSGNNQFGVVGQSLPLPFIAVVTDAGHNRIPGVPVTFTVKQGGGNISGQPSVTLNSDGDGRIQAILTLGADAGTNNNVVEATFPGNTAFPASFTATARTLGPAAATAISGVVVDNSNQPIPGVTMRLFQLNQGPSGNLPQQVGTPVQTDGEGQFIIQPAPVGVFKLMADGGTATRPGVWPTLEYDIITTPGQNNTVGSPIYLPQLNPDNKLCVTPGTGGTLTVPQVPGFSLTIAPGSATFPGGSHTGCVTVTPVNMDKVPMVPGFGQQPRFVVTIQPVGTTFNPPAAMTIPNVDGLAPRAVTEMYSYDHDLASFVAIGSATVSDDGSVIRSDPGVGVLKAGWHCGGDPNSTGSAASLSLSVSPTDVTVVVGEQFDVTANGAPPLDGSYQWTPASNTTSVSTPSCAGQGSCVGTFKGDTPGKSTLNVCFVCSTTGATKCQNVNVTVVKIELKKLSFTTDHHLMRDNNSDYTATGTVFSKPDWTDAGTNNPISHTMSQNVGVSLEFLVTPSDAPSRSYHIKGTGPTGLNFDSTINLAGGSPVIPLTSTDQLATKVQKLTGSINWVITSNSQTVMTTPTGSHVVYVTIGTPRNDGTVPGTVTQKRMERAVSAVAGAGSLDPNAIVKTVVQDQGAFDLNKPQANEWVVPDTGGDCQSIVRFTKAVLDMINVPGTIVQDNIYAIETAPTTGIEDGTGGGLNTHVRVNPNGLWVLSLIDGSVHADGSKGCNAFESTAKFTFNSITKYYAGGTTGIFDNPDQVLTVFTSLSWVAGAVVNGQTECFEKQVVYTY
jgi:glucodextranase-like protein